mmetsp:Transcript_5378/g.15386  ORF Transcript_5378/g.15386 Transcript_5378/m.15386 type:complete len:104 (-) Transcript_5378:293-604(-)|eukprot:CAMPEP_0194481248 /NCGR_PEP_ID=MMETSP0253-20130528/3760_1 /TAXON_ID=2966 /ORGANISM="Noctiluca scintillans" /LENGTH=103 /DNA_ID=CAMNT_0039320719 /DNA_START=84 /DNA_END=395 /DNA_ORIENTATION=+
MPQEKFETRVLKSSLSETSLGTDVSDPWSRGATCDSVVRFRSQKSISGVASELVLNTDPPVPTRTSTTRSCWSGKWLCCCEASRGEEGDDEAISQVINSDFLD